LRCSNPGVQPSLPILRRLMSDPVPTEIRLRRTSRLLEVSFADGSRFELPFEYLRVHSPSAEVKGHGPGQEVLVLGKENVAINAVEPVRAVRREAGVRRRARHRALHLEVPA